jgi:glycosyltransferase involved in cell wall biosynthesis
VKALTQKMNDVHIDIIGNIVDERYFNSIARQLEEDKLDHHVTFLTNVSDVQNLLSKYAMGLHFSKRESGPLVLLEYLAQELPFVSFLTGEIANNLQTDLPDFFVKDFDPGNWCDKIDKHLTSKSYTPSLDIIFKKHNNTDQYVKKCLTIYQSIIS